MAINKRISSVSYEAIRELGQHIALAPTPVENMTATAADAKYLLRVKPAAEYAEDDYLQAVVKATSHSFEETRREYDTLMETIAKLIDEGYTYIDTGYFTFELRFEGSIEGAADKPNAAENAAYIGIYPSNELAQTLALIKANLSKESAPFTITTVFRAGTHDRFIMAGESFLVNGEDFPVDAAAKIEVVLPDGTHEEIEPQDVTDVQLRASAPRELPASKAAMLRVTFTKDGKTVSAEKENVIIKTPPTPPEPRIVKVVSEATGQTGAWKAVADTLTVTTANAEGEDAELKLTLIEAGGRTTEMPLTGENKVERVDAKTMKVVITCNDSTEPDMVWQDPSATRRLTLTTGSGTASVDLALAT